MERDKTNRFVQEVLLSASSAVRCALCGVEEMVMPLEDQPLDEAFLVNYVCDECEKSEAQ